MRVKSECQRLLTVEKRACGNALERLEGRVGLESLREVFCALLTELVVLEPASEGAFRVSAAIDCGKKSIAAHSSFLRAEFVLRASDRCLAPSGPSSLPKSLRARAKSECQQLLTAEKRACGGARERVESRVHLESFRDVLGALRTDIVVIESASKGGFRVLAAIDCGKKGVWRRT